MRTNLVLDDDVARKAKAFAAEQGLTLSELANRALSNHLARAKQTSRLSDTLKHMSHTGPGRKILAHDVLHVVNTIRDDGR